VGDGFFGYHVSDPNSLVWLEFDAKQGAKPVSIGENLKPKVNYGRSTSAYFYD